MSESLKRKKGKKRKKKVSTKKKILITLGVILLFFIGIGISALGYGFSLLNQMDTVVIDDNNLSINDSLSKYKNIKNIALFGVDSTDGGSGRSDSIMILTIDGQHNKIKLTSIMRDSYVDIANHGTDKINHAYAFGGPELAVRTLNENFNLNISDFASVNFSTLPKIIDILGGVEINIKSQEELKYLNQYIRGVNRETGTNASEISSTGVHHLNGVQCLAYSRIRYTSGGDFERTERQRTVLNALFEKFKNTSPTKFPSILNEILPLVQTTLTPKEIISIGTNVLKFNNLAIEQERFPRDEYSNGEMINGVYYLTFDKAATTEQIHNYLFNDIK